LKSKIKITQSIQNCNEIVPSF